MLILFIVFKQSQAFRLFPDMCIPISNCKIIVIYMLYLSRGVMCMVLTSLSELSHPKLKWFILYCLFMVD